MKAGRIKAALVLALAFGTLAGAHAWRPTARLADARPKVELEQMFPKSFGEWANDDRMPVQLVSPDAQAVLDRIYNQTLSRTYVNSRGERIMLSVAYGGDQSDGTRAHRPEVCYPAQGFQIVANSEGTIRTAQHPVRVRHLVAKAGGRNEPISYWVVVGDRITLSGTEQKLAQLSYSLRGVVPDGMLVRVSSISANADEAYRLQEAFVAAMSSAIPAQYRAQIIGASGMLSN